MYLYFYFAVYILFKNIILLLFLANVDYHYYLFFTTRYNACLYYALYRI